MQITTKNIRNISLSSFLLCGVAACSNTPAPWTQQDDSPWGAKREAEAQNIPADEVVVDTSLNDPVLLADPEPEAIEMQEPDIAPAPEVIMPVVVEDEPAANDIMAMLSSNYAVQVYAGQTLESVEKFKSSKGLDELTTVKTVRSGSIVYVLVDIHPDLATANAAAVELEAKTGSKPWVRSLSGLQKIVAQ